MNAVGGDKWITLHYAAVGGHDEFVRRDASCGISPFSSQSSMVVRLHSNRSTQFVRLLLFTASSWDLDMTLVIAVRERYRCNEPW